MITITKTGTNINGGNTPVLEIRGLSTDEKPTENIGNGSVFIEIDSGKIFFYDLENEQWKEF